MLAETVILRPVPGDREPGRCATKRHGRYIGLPSNEIHAYFITVYDCEARISISWIFYEVVFPSVDDKISARAVVYASSEIRLCGTIKRSLIVCAVFCNLNDISIIIR